ncbi:uroporphyrinogen-III synthase [Candidatus Pelagibacter sp.]|nr:uroporphyrinogen-III synthase [Candidatus Pelagibacter sp.]
MHILLTRPLEDSKDLIIKFKSLGHQVSHLPVINIEKKDYEDPNYNEFKGIIFTSSNSIKNLDISKINKDIFCFCVGNATEKIAKEKGFQNIFTAEGNVSNLKEIILQNFDPKNGNLLYISGEIISNELDKELKSEGYSVKRVVNYSVNSNEKLSDEFVEQLKTSIPEIVFIYSENSARSYLNILKKYNLIDNWMNTNLMCLGEKSSSVLNEIKWKKIFLFNPGEEEYLLYKI